MLMSVDKKPPLHNSHQLTEMQDTYMNISSEEYKGNDYKRYPL